LEPFALTIPVRTSLPWAGTQQESARRESAR